MRIDFRISIKAWRTIHTIVYVVDKNEKYRNLPCYISIDRHTLELSERFKNAARRKGILNGKFTLGIVAGTCLGVAISMATLDRMRPDVTSKMMRNGRKMVQRCKKQMNVC